jgi:hypothetical protein
MLRQLAEGVSLVFLGQARRRTYREASKSSKSLRFDEITEAPRTQVGERNSSPVVQAVGAYTQRICAVCTTFTVSYSRNPLFGTHTEGIGVGGHSSIRSCEREPILFPPV